MNPLTNPLYKEAATPYKDGGEYYLLIVRYVLGEGLGEARPIEARNYHQGFLRGLEFAEKFS